MAEYSREQLWKLFDKLPSDLRDAVLSEDTANTIRDICQRHKVKDKNVPTLAGMVGNILMGLLSPEEFPEALEEELKIDPERAKKISQEVNRFILFPVRDSLVEFYREIRFAPGGRLIKPEVKEERAPRKVPTPEKKRPPKEDIYREPIE